MFGEECRINSVTFKIKRLGAITDSELTLSQFLILSGESGLGKSYIAMMCNYVFFLLWSRKRLNNFIKEQGISFNDSRLNWKNKGEAFVIYRVDFISWVNRDLKSFLSYMIGSEAHADIEVSLPIPEELRFGFSEEIEGLVDAEESYLRLNINNDLFFRTKNEDESIGSESPLAFMLRYYLIDRIFGNHNGFKYNYILPPSRGGVMTENVEPVTGLFKEFTDMLRIINTSADKPNEVDPHLQEEFRSILDGRVYKEKSSGKYFYETNNANIPISAAASSIKEIAPLSLFINRFDVSVSSILIEEPEAHLHPLKQRMMADVLAMLVNNKACIQITTHSDYLIRRINELVLLNQIYDNYKENPEEFEKICDELNIPSYLKLNHECIGAYLLQRREDGTVEIVSQNANDGVKFDSFYKALRQNIDMHASLMNYLEEGVSNARD